MIKAALSLFHLDFSAGMAHSEDADACEKATRYLCARLNYLNGRAWRFHRGVNVASGYRSEHPLEFHMNIGHMVFLPGRDLEEGETELWA